MKISTKLNMRSVVLLGTLGVTSVCTAIAIAEDPYYLVCTGTQNSVRKYDLDGNFLQDLVPPLSGGLSRPNYLDIGPDGNLYVTGYGSHKVHRYNLQTGAFIDIAAQGAEMNGPTYLKFSPKGNLIVSSYNAGRILEYDSATREFLGDYVDSNSLQNGHGLQWDDDGNVLVADFSAGMIRRFDVETGAYIDGFSPAGIPNPTTFAFSPTDPKRRKYILSGYNTTIVREFETDGGNQIRTILGDARLRNVDGVSFSHNGTIFLSSWGTNEVREYDYNTGEFLGNFAELADGLRTPVSIQYIDPEQPRLWVDTNCNGAGGQASIQWTNATPNGQAAILYAKTRGNYAIPGSNAICPGVGLGLGSSQLQIGFVGPSNGAGSRTINTSFPASMCGGFIQLIDLSRCKLSEANQL